MPLRSASLLLLAALGTALAAAPARAERRVAVIAGHRDGGGDVRPLRYAVTDAERMHRILTTVGGIAREDAKLLADPTADELLKALDAAEARARGGVVLFYYSGHARDGFLRLGRTRLELSRLRERLSSMGARAKVAILDSCRSGEIVRTKGGRVVPAFQVTAEPSGPRGLVVLASSAADEDSQESDLLGASFFTHFLASGLVGDADANGDGRITVQEAYAYAYVRTVAQTAEARAGIQHPTFAYSLAGAGELWLTDVSRATSVLLLPAASAGAYVVVDATRRTLVAELDKPAGVARRVALPPGRYEVKRRDGGDALFARVRLDEGETVTLHDGDMERLALAAAGAKGADWAGALAQQRPLRWTAAGVLARQAFFGGRTREQFFPDLTLFGGELEFRDAWKSPGTVVGVDVGGGSAALNVRLGALDVATQVSQWSAGFSWIRELELGRFVPYGGLRLSLLGVRRDFADERFPTQSLVTAAPGVVAGVHFEIARAVSLGVRGRASFLLYRTEEDLSLGFADLGLTLRWEAR